MKKLGKFIVVEGADGTGKTTLIENLRQHADDLGVPVIFTKEPGGTEIGDKVRKILLSHHDPCMEPLTELFLFAASRSQHVAEKIRPAIEAGKMVICDRFVPSSFAYQVRGHCRPKLEPAFHEINRMAVQGMNPDLYILLELPVDKARERMAARGEENNRFDLYGLEFQHRVREGMLEYIADFPFATLNACEEAEVVWQQALGLIRKLLAV